MRIPSTAIIGAGGWGTALAGLWAKKNAQKIILWGHNADRIARMQNTRENVDYLPGIQIPDSVHITSELDDCADADVIVLAVPSTALRNIAADLAKVTGLTSVLLCCTKGIEHGTGMRMTEILRETFPENKIAVLSGPNLATEVARDLPTATVIACGDGDCAASLQTALGNPRFRIYTSLDVVSVELGGALKNVFAIAAGISDGLGLGDNAKSAVVTRSLAELVRFGAAMGGTANAFYGLSGAGDLILTCYSDRSRNHSVGKRLGRGEMLSEITASMKMVAEGIPTARSAWECARRLDIATPITDQVYSILYQQEKPAVALEELLKREPKPESA
jgi:glycerol-3-phosphate dehydrogenase (NAD(P)+)